MSLVAYNGVILPYAHISQFRQEAVRDDMSDTDWYCSKYDIQTEMVINTDYLPLIAPSLVGQTTNPAAIMAAIYTKLMTHRKTLSVKFNDVEFIPQATAGGPGALVSGTVDAQNGPKPQSCNYTMLTNTTFLLTFHIIAMYWVNYAKTSDGTVQIPPQNQQGNNVLYNRWTETVDIDNTNYTRRTREGKFVIRSDADQPIIADMLRSSMAVVGVPAGFLRESSQYVVTPDGLAIKYRVVDKEVFKLPPIPAFRANGEYIQNTSKFGNFKTSQVRVALEASKDTDQAFLLQTALQVASAKMQLANPELGDTSAFGILNTANLKVDLYENNVEVCLTAFSIPNPGERKGVWGIDYNNPGLVATPGSDPDDNPDQPPYDDRGTASILLQAAAYYDPSLKDTILDPSTGQLTNGVEVGSAGVTPEP